MTPPLFRSFIACPASANLAPNTFRAPKFVPTSQICNFAFEPAAASVNGSSGDHTAEKTSPFRQVSTHRVSLSKRSVKNSTHQSEVAASDEADLPFFTRLIPLNVPYFHHFVRTGRGEASADVRVDVQGTRCTVVRRDREARGGRLVKV